MIQIKGLSLIFKINRFSFLRYKTEMKLAKKVHK